MAEWLDAREAIILQELQEPRRERGVVSLSSGGGCESGEEESLREHGGHWGVASREGLQGVGGELGRWRVN